VPVTCHPLDPSSRRAVASPSTASGRWRRSRSTVSAARSARSAGWAGTDDDLHQGTSCTRLTATGGALRSELTPSSTAPSNRTGGTPSGRPCPERVSPRVASAAPIGPTGMPAGTTRTRSGMARSLRNGDPATWRSTAATTASRRGALDGWRVQLGARRHDRRAWRGRADRPPLGGWVRVDGRPDPAAVRGRRRRSRSRPMLPGQVREIGADHLAPFAAGAGGHRHRLPGGEVRDSRTAGRSRARRRELPSRCPSPCSGRRSPAGSSR